VDCYHIRETELFCQIGYGSPPAAVCGKKTQLIKIGQEETHIKKGSRNIPKESGKPIFLLIGSVNIEKRFNFYAASPNFLIFDLLNSRSA